MSYTYTIYLNHIQPSVFPHRSPPGLLNVSHLQFFFFFDNSLSPLNATCHDICNVLVTKPQIKVTPPSLKIIKCL